MYVSDIHLPEELVLQVRGHALSFLTARPLSESQRIDPPSGPEGWATLRVHLAPDPELLGHLLMLSPNVRAVGPKGLAARFRAILTEASRRNPATLQR